MSYNYLLYFVQGLGNYVTVKSIFLHHILIFSPFSNINIKLGIKAYNLQKTAEKSINFLMSYERLNMTPYFSDQVIFVIILQIIHHLKDIVPNFQINLSKILLCILQRQQNKLKILFIIPGTVYSIHIHTKK